VDPGAVPGGSTKILFLYNDENFRGAETGSTRVIKAICGVRGDLPHIGSIMIVANDNVAPMTAANDNGTIAAVAA